MPAEQPFEPNIGGTLAVTAVSTSPSGSVTLNMTGGFSNTIYVASNSTVMLFCRLDKSSVTQATSIDVPIPPNSAVILANPVPTGNTFCSVSGSVFGTGSGTVFFVPGQGGGA